MESKIGIGYDIHHLVHGRKLFLGGVEIPYIKGLFGHSDADALLHAICDAILGALGQGDIGEHFPDTDPKYHNIPSTELLKSVMGLLKAGGFGIDNVDTVIIAQEPPLAPFKKHIRTKIAGVLEIKEDCVNIKAKTNEGLDATGRKEAIACWAAVMITKKEGQ